MTVSLRFAGCFLIICDSYLFVLGFDVFVINLDQSFLGELISRLSINSKAVGKLGTFVGTMRGGRLGDCDLADIWL